MSTKAEKVKALLAQFPNPQPIGVGGQKEVYCIDDDSYGRAALKIGEYSTLQQFERIRREVEALSKISSPYFPRQYDFQNVGRGMYVIVEEYIDSVPLSDRVGEYADPKQALLLVRELSNALNILWSSRIVHRDVKPDNVLIKPDGSLVLIDLGIARMLDKASLTHTAYHRGPATPAFAAPEQLTNNKAQIDHRADQFNIGLLLVMLLNGGLHPFAPPAVEGDLVQNIIHGRWGWMPVTGEEAAPIRPFATKLLGREPYMRYRSASAFMAALEALIVRYHVA
jgi:eukaryotic-like serine/threonine-protein kinase